MAALLHIHPQPFGIAAPAATVARATEPGVDALGGCAMASAKLTLDIPNPGETNALVARCAR